MRRQANLTFRQQQSRILAHFAVQPWVRIGGCGPGAIVQTGEEDKVGRNLPRLAWAVDGDQRVTGDRAAHLFLGDQAVEQRAVIGRGKRACVIGFAGEHFHQLLGGNAGILGP